MFQQIIDGVDDGGDQVIATGLCLGSCMVGLLDGKWRQLSHAYNVWAGSPTPVLRVGFSTVMSQLFHLPQLLRNGGGQLFPTHAITRQMGIGSSSIMFTISGLTHSHLP